VDQVEFSNIILINKADLVSEEDLFKLEGILKHLNPEARLVRTTFGKVLLSEILSTGLFDFEKAAQAPGWLKELRGEHIPETEEYGISSFVYRANRPFHPERFRDFLDEGWDGVVRSKGFFWLATRMEYAMIWSQAGGACRIEPGPAWWVIIPEEDWPQEAELRQEILTNWQKPWGDRRQEIVFIGMEMDKDWLVGRLNECLLTDDEFDIQTLSFMRLPDPFPQYAPAIPEEVEALAM
jgi:G3E family GTPase